MPARSRLPLLPTLALLAAGLGAALLWAGDDAAALLGFERGPGAGDVGRDTFDGRAPDGPGPHAGPRLTGSAPATPGLTRGPVVVTVVDEGAGPVAGVRVLVRPRVDPPAGEPPAVPGLVLRTTDGSGRASFDDLPYDGSFEALALARAALPPLAEGAPLGPAVAIRGTGQALFRALTPPGDAEEATITIVERPGDGSEARPVPLLTDLPTLGHLFRKQAPAPADPTADGSALEQVRATIRGPEATLVVPRGLPFRLEVRLAGDGRALPGTRWQAAPRLEWAEDAFHSPRVAVKPGTEAAVHVRVEPVPGTVARVDAGWSTWIHPAAERLEALYPLRPALDLVLVFPDEVLPFRESDFEGRIEVAGLGLEAPELAFVGHGRLRARGGSHCVTERVRVTGTLAGRWSVRGEALVGPDPRATVLVALEVQALPPAPAPTEEPQPGKPLELRFELAELTVVNRGNAVRILLGPNVAGAGSDGKLVILEEGAAAAAPAPPPGALVVRALAPDGAPVPGAVVRVGERTLRADATGRARFEGLAPGPFTAAVLGAGATGSASGTVAPGRTTELELRPGRGGTLDVELVDADGNAIPMGSLRVVQPSGLPWLDVARGVQRLDPFTDARGRRTLEGVETGRLTVRGSYGTRTASVEVELAEGQRVPVRLVLPVERP